MCNEGNQIHNFMSSSGSGTVINYGSGSDFLTSYGSGSTSKKVTVPRVPVPQRCCEYMLMTWDFATFSQKKFVDRNFSPKYVPDWSKWKRQLENVCCVRKSLNYFRGNENALTIYFGNFAKIDKILPKYTKFREIKHFRSVSVSTLAGFERDIASRQNLLSCYASARLTVWYLQWGSGVYTSRLWSFILGLFIWNHQKIHNQGKISQIMYYT